MEEYKLYTASPSAKVSKAPAWKLEASKLKNRDHDTAKRYNRQFIYGSTEVGMKNPKNNSHIKIFDNGDIETFAGDNTGIRINDKYDTVSIYGYGFNVNSQYINLNTHPYGVRWNGYTLNPQLYWLSKHNYEGGGDLQLQGTVKCWVEDDDYDDGGYWTRRSVSVPAFIETSVDDEYNSLLKELGIPI